MISFKQYLIESASGNYVCIQAEDMSSYFSDIGLSIPSTGTPPPDYHCTLMYSTGSHIEPDRIYAAMRSSGFDMEHTAKIIGFDCFDGDDGDKSCIVAKLDSMALYQMHDLLKGMGLRHSYPNFIPHITLRYNMSVQEAHKYRELLEGNTGTVKLNGFKSETINRNYV